MTLLARILKLKEDFAKIDCDKWNSLHNRDRAEKLLKLVGGQGQNEPIHAVFTECYRLIDSDFNLAKQFNPNILLDYQTLLKIIDLMIKYSNNLAFE